MDHDIKTDRTVRWLVCIVLVLAFLASAFVLAVVRFDIPLETLWKQSAEQAAAEAPLPADGWRYLDGGREPGLGTLWATPHYDDGGWSTGRGRFLEQTGAGDQRSVQALLSASEDGAPARTYFFRREFTVEMPGAVWALTGTIRYSDAVLVYLNGTVVFAGNVPAGGFETNQDEGCAADPGKIHEETLLVTDLTMLREGENVLAVELHQADAAEENACFQLGALKMLGEEVPETAPDLQNVFLEQGDGENCLWVNWLTDDAGYYALEYMTEQEYARLEGMEDGFHLYADRVLMGRTYDGDRGSYLNRAPISHLKTGEPYLYCIVPVGSGTPSDLRSFNAAGNTRCTFAVLGGDVTAENAQTKLSQAMGQAERLDFLVADRSLTDDGQGPASRIPTRFLPEGGADRLPFQSALVVLLGDDMTDLTRQEDYIRQAMEEFSLPWVIVVLPGGGAGPETGERLREDLGVDMVIDPRAQDVLVVDVTMDGPLAG